MRTTTMLLALCGLLLLSATSLLAQDSLKDVKPGEVPSYCGIAVGEEEQKYDASGPMPWTLKLVFAEKGSGQYLSNVEVTIADDKGTEWSQTLCEGAWVVFALPAGDYDLTCIYSDSSQKRKVHVTEDKTRTEYFYW